MALPDGGMPWVETKGQKWGPMATRAPPNLVVTLAFLEALTPSGTREMIVHASGQM